MFARDVRLPADADLFYLERGQAQAVRADVNAGYLVCPIPGCDQPSFVVRAGSRRDHFAHKPGATGHAPETVDHHTAKHLIARWLRRHHPNASVTVDERTITTGRRPDVLVELPGGLVGYEIQRAPLTADQWRARHDDYTRSRVKDVWVFVGHTYAPPVSATTPAFRRMHPALAAVLAAGRPVIFLDPVSRLVALAVGADVADHLAAGGYRPPPLGAVRVDAWYDLDDVPAPGGVIDVPGTRDLLADLGDRRVAWRRRCEQDDVGGRVRGQERLQRTATNLRPGRSGAGRSAKVRYTFTPPPRPAPPPVQPVEGAPADLAGAFQHPQARALGVLRQEAGDRAGPVPVQVLRELPRRLHKVAEVLWYHVTQLSPQAPVRYLTVADVPGADLADVVAALVRGGVVRLERLPTGEYRYTTQSPDGDTTPGGHQAPAPSADRTRKPRKPPASAVG